MIIRTKAYPRAGLVGNPSDGYFGKTISFALSNFCAEVVLYETPELEILPSLKDHSGFDRMTGPVRDIWVATRGWGSSFVPSRLLPGRTMFALAQGEAWARDMIGDTDEDMCGGRRICGVGDGRLSGRGR